MADRVVVPKEMLKAAMVTARRLDSPATESHYRIVVEAALRWFCDDLSKSDKISPALNGTYQDGWLGAWKHIQRIFLAPKPEVICTDDSLNDGLVKSYIWKNPIKPEVPEVIKDLMKPLGNVDVNREIGRRIVEAYRRGKESKDAEAEAHQGRSQGAEEAQG